MNLEQLIEEKISGLVDVGRTKANPGLVISQPAWMMSEIEMVELSRLLMMRDRNIFSKEWAGQFMDAVLDDDCNLISLLVDCCADDSEMNVFKLLQKAKHILVKEFEDEVNDLLAAEIRDREHREWEKECNARHDHGYRQARYSDNGEAYWTKY